MLFWASMNRITAAIEASSTPLCRVVRAVSSVATSIVRPTTGGSAPRIPLLPDFRRGWDPGGVVPVPVGPWAREPAGGEEDGDAGGTGGANDSAGFDTVGFGAGGVCFGAGDVGCGVADEGSGAGDDGAGDDGAGDDGAGDDGAGEDGAGVGPGTTSQRKVAVDVCPAAVPLSTSTVIR